MSRVIGIDLGTTNCCVAVFADGRAEVIPNRHGYSTTPSMVAVTPEGKRIVGQLAMRQAVTNPEHTVFASKRLLGARFDTPEVKRIAENAPFELVEGADSQVEVVLGEQALTMPEISAVLLQEMRVVAEAHLGEEVSQAVVTVPAYFNDRQRQSVRHAGLIAGMEVLQILNEPTAAAIAYGFKNEGERVIAVYDLGGGTFDVSIVRVEQNDFEVLSTIGDSFLGGEDFDDRILDWFLRGFEVQQGIDLRQHPIAMQRLKHAVQKVRCDLSELKVSEVKLPFIATSADGKPLTLHYAISRDQVNKLTADLVDRSLDICGRAIELAKLKTSDIDDVVMVGGMTRTPLVRTRVTEFFGRPLNKDLHPDEVVALGAAIQGASLVSDDVDLSLADVTAHTLGLATAGGGFAPMIPANTRVPCSVPSTFTTHRDNQARITIQVLQGESKQSAENELLQSFHITELRQALAGEVSIEVLFEIDDDGILSVQAMDLETGRKVRVAIGGEEQTESELARMVAESHEFLEARRSAEAFERLRLSTSSLVGEVDSLLHLARARTSLNPMQTLTLTHAEHASSTARQMLDQENRMGLAEHIVLLEDAVSSLQELLGN